MYNLEIRETKQFELYNDLEIGDRAELSFLLKVGEGPKKAKTPIKAEKLWVEIESFIYESQNIYRATVKDQPLFLKELKKGDQIDFAPENVLKAKRKKAHVRIKDISGFVYAGKSKNKEDLKRTIRKDDFTYAMDPPNLVIRSAEILEGSIPFTDLKPENQKDLDAVIETFEMIQPDKYHLRIDRGFIKKCLEKLREQHHPDDSATITAIIRVSDRTFVPFTIVRKILRLLKSVLIYLDAPSERHSLYFKSDTYEGFISLANQTADSIIFDAMEK